MPTLTNLKLLNSPKKDDFFINEKIEFIPLGTGRITFIDRQKTLTKGKYNLLLEAILDSGQSILVSKLFNGLIDISVNEEPNELETLLRLATKKLKPNILKKLKEFIDKQKKLTKEQLEIITELINNEE